MMSTFSIKKNWQERGSGIGRPARKGLVFIPDISGFTELVRSTDLITGKSITYELLSTIIKHNVLNLEIAEIEGDAIFFFKWQPFPCINNIIEQFDILKRAFDKKKGALQRKYKVHLNLHLKAVAHHGTMTEFSLGGFRKLYGEVVIEAHRLLKNNIPEHSYLLITDGLASASISIERGEPSIEGLRSSELCEIYDGLRDICFTYILFENSLAITA